MAAKKSDGDIYIANQSFAADLDGSPIVVRKGETRVREGHALLKQFPEYFERADSKVHFDVERATAAPGEKRK